MFSPPRVPALIACVMLVGTAQEKVDLPGPAEQNMMLGSWSIVATAVPGEKRNSSGAGTELWYPGPGGKSIIEELRIKTKKDKESIAFGPGWWDPEAKGQRFLWCADSMPPGCVISKNVSKWEGDRSVYNENQEVDGKKTTRQELFYDITPTSFSQRISVGPDTDNLQPVWTAKATRLPRDEPRLNFPISSANNGTSPSSEMQKLTQKMIGTWSLQLKTAPSKEMSNGGGGQGTEVWKAGPGGYSLIETYESKGDEGEITGLGILWPEDKEPGYQVLWCDNQGTLGCHILKGGARWEGGQLVLRDESNTSGHTQKVRETFTFNSSNTFVQNVFLVEQGGALKPYVTIQGSRK